VRRCVLKYEILFKKEVIISPSSKVPVPYAVPCFLKCSIAVLFLYLSVDPDPGSQTKRILADSDPAQDLKSQKVEFLHEIDTVPYLKY
jgi:hypothetical protein